VWLSFQGEYLNESAAFATTHEREEQVWKEYVRRVLREAGVPIVGEHLEQAVAAVYEAFSRGSSRRVASGAVEFLHAMQQSELPVVAATNNDRRVELVLEELGLTGYFDEIVTSGHLGWKKPSPYFFAGISNLLEIPAGELLHIGNDLELDVRAAQRAGFQGQFFGSSQDGESAIENFDALRLSVMQLVDAPRVGRE
jgi:FMN phosphatase YigB (HAD superfamily)